MPIYVRPFKQTDLKAFRPIENIKHNEEFSPEMAQVIEDSGLAITGLRNGRIVGCGGIHPLNKEKEQGELWLRLSKECLKYRLDTLRWLREALEIIEETYPFRQLNAAIRSNYSSRVKLVESLGFHKVQSVIYKGKEWFVFSKRVKE